VILAGVGFGAFWWTQIRVPPAPKTAEGVPIYTSAQLWAMNDRQRAKVLLPEGGHGTRKELQIDGLTAVCFAYSQPDGKGWITANYFPPQMWDKRPDWHEKWLALSESSLTKIAKPGPGLTVIYLYRPAYGSSGGTLACRGYVFGTVAYGPNPNGNRNGLTIHDDAFSMNLYSPFCPMECLQLNPRSR